MKYTLISAVFAVIFFRLPPRPDVEATIQERAYSSPIWVN
ncbi:MAG: DUF3604 domain-containing protein [Parvibaculales bacterium]